MQLGLGSFASFAGEEGNQRLRKSKGKHYIIDHDRLHFEAHHMTDFTFIGSYTHRTQLQEKHDFPRENHGFPMISSFFSWIFSIFSTHAHGTTSCGEVEVSSFELPLARIPACSDLIDGHPRPDVLCLVNKGCYGSTGGQP